MPARSVTPCAAYHCSSASSMLSGPATPASTFDSCTPVVGAARLVADHGDRQPPVRVAREHFLHETATGHPVADDHEPPPRDPVSR